jgi:hypothetical protein
MGKGSCNLERESLGTVLTNEGGSWRLRVKSGEGAAHRHSRSVRRDRGGEREAVGGFGDVRVAWGRKDSDESLWSTFIAEGGEGRGTRWRGVGERWRLANGVITRREGVGEGHAWGCGFLYEVGQVAVREGKREREREREREVALT